jgi:hypothetical protein
MKKLFVLAMLLASPAYAEEVKLVWLPNPAAENVIRYHVYRSEGLVSTTALPKDFRPVGASVTTSATDIAPDDGLTYTYVIRAFNGVNEGPPSDEIVVTTTKAASKVAGAKRVEK